MPDNQPSTPDSANVERTATGQIADQKQTTVAAATTPQTSTTPETSTPTADDKSLINADGKSIANQTPAPEAGAPETYAAFSVPEGYTLDEETAKDIGVMFKADNMTQERAQKYVDWYIARQQEVQNAPYDLWRQTQQDWVKQVRNDPFLGPRLNQVTNTISRAIDAAAGNNTQLKDAFRQVMDFTGAGNHPAFIRMFYEMASKITEGGHVSGKGPSPAGQNRPGGMPTAAEAMYPNLRSGREG